MSFYSNKTQKIVNKLSSNNVARSNKFSNSYALVESVNSELQDLYQSGQKSIGALSVDTYTPYQNGTYYVINKTPITTLTGDGHDIVEVDINDSEFIKQSIPNRVSLETIEYEHKEILAVTPLLREGIIESNHSGTIPAPTYIHLTKDGMLVDDDGKSTAVTIYGLDYHGKHISESIPFYIPGIQRLTRSFYYYYGYTTSTSLDISDVTIRIGNYYDAENNIINDYSYLEEDSNKDIYHITWNYNATSTLTKTSYTSRNISEFLRGNSQLSDTKDYILTSDGTSTINIDSILVDDVNKYVYTLADGDFITYDKEDDISNIVQHVGSKPDFCPLEVDAYYNAATLNIEFKGLFKVSPRANRVFKYRFRVITLTSDEFMNTNNITSVNTTTEAYDINTWHEHSASANYGFISPEYTYTLGNKDIAVVLDVMDVNGAITSTVEYVLTLYKTPIKINTIGSSVDSVLSFDNNNRIIIEDTGVYSYINYHYDNYYTDDSSIYWLDTYSEVLLNEEDITDLVVSDKVNSEIDDIAIALELERKVGESTDDFVPFVNQLRHTNIGSNEKNLVYGVSTELRSMIQPAVLETFNNKEVVIHNKILTIDGSSNDLYNYVIDDVASDLTGTTLSNGTENAEYLLPYKNYRTIEAIIQKNTNMYPIIGKHEKISQAYPLSSNIDSGDVTVYDNTYIVYTGDLEYITIIIVVIEKYYMLHYSNTAVWGLEQYMDIHKASMTEADYLDMVSDIYDKAELHAPTRLI